MTNNKQTRLDWRLAQAEIYSVGYSTLVLLQAIGACGTLLCGFVLAMELNYPRWDEVSIRLFLTLASAFVWRWSAKKLGAVGPKGKSLSYNPFTGSDDPTS